MTLLRRLLGWLGVPREAVGQPPAPRPPSPAAIPVHAIGEALPAPPLAALLRAAGFGDADGWAAALLRPMRAHGIAGPRRVAAFLATIAHESNGGRQLEENLSYSADRIMAVWPARFPTREAAERLARDPFGLAESVYGGRMGNARPGDGWHYRGRGLIQITGAANYGMAAEGVGLPLLEAPDMATGQGAAAAIAAWWWAGNGCNELADSGDMEAWRRRVNGGLQGLHDVRRRYVDVLAAMGAAA